MLPEANFTTAKKVQPILHPIPEKPKRQNREYKAKRFVRKNKVQLVDNETQVKMMLSKLDKKPIKV